MKTSQDGIDFIAAQESLVLRAYKPVRSEALWTIGYGHYGVTEGTVWTAAQARAALERDLAVAEKAVTACSQAIKRAFTQSQFDALVSFVFNCGSAALAAGKTLGNALRRAFTKVPEAMAAYVKDGAGNVLKGLVERRRLEGGMFARKLSPSSWLTAVELRRVRELDQLRRLPALSKAQAGREDVLVRVLTEQRKRIWTQAQPRAKGGDGRGWDYRNRRQRYSSLLARTA